MDEALGVIMRPARVQSAVPAPRAILERHPMISGTGRCAICGRRWAQAYSHPNPLRPGVVLWRCARHRGPRFARDDPKAALGGGVYK